MFNKLKKAYYLPALFSLCICVIYMISNNNVFADQNFTIAQGDGSVSSEGIIGDLIKNRTDVNVEGFIVIEEDIEVSGPGPITQALSGPKAFNFVTVSTGKSTSAPFNSLTVTANVRIKSNNVVVKEYVISKASASSEATHGSMMIPSFAAEQIDLDGDGVTETVTLEWWLEAEEGSVSGSGGTVSILTMNQ